jgi:hypothetical protein
LIVSFLGTIYGWNISIKINGKLKWMILMMFFGVNSLCGLVGRSQCFREACCLHLQGCRASALKMETAHFCEMVASTNKSTWRFNPEEHHQNCHHSENLKYHKKDDFKIMCM